MPLCLPPLPPQCLYNKHMPSSSPSFFFYYMSCLSHPTLKPLRLPSLPSNTYYLFPLSQCAFRIPSILYGGLPSFPSRTSSFSICFPHAFLPVLSVDRFLHAIMLFLPGFPIVFSSYLPAPSLIPTYTTSNLFDLLLACLWIFPPFLLFYPFPTCLSSFQYIPSSSIGYRTCLPRL